MQNARDKKLPRLYKQLGWYANANDADGVFDMVKKIHQEEAARLEELPDCPQKAILLDNLKYQEFELYNMNNEKVKQAHESAEELSELLIKALIIEEEDKECASLFLRQYFFEKLSEKAVFIDRDGTEYSDWRELMRSPEF